MNTQTPEVTAGLNPEFNDGLFDPNTFIEHVDELIKEGKPVPHNKNLDKLLEKIEPINIRELAELDEKGNLRNDHYLVIVVEQILRVAQQCSWGICKHQNSLYLYNGAYWQQLEKDILKSFLVEAAKKMGIDKFKSQVYYFQNHLLKQLHSAAKPAQHNLPKDAVLINLQDGTFEVTPSGPKPRTFAAADFITHQLPFAYNPEAKAPIYEAFLNRVLPDLTSQMVLAEYLGYVFLKNGTIREEKVLFLLGKGANGKSVIHSIVQALFGAENTTHFSLQDLTDESGYYRAKIAGKLVNYASEISGKLEAATFKQLASGEPITARLPHGHPMEITDYTKFIFNVNELPRNVEHTPAFFRRFLIIPFDVTIPEAEQDKELHLKIINKELAGVFNWVLAGLNRLLKQKHFTPCAASQLVQEQYKTQSDNVKLFLEDHNYQKSANNYILIKELYPLYRTFCSEDGFPPLNKSDFKKRLLDLGIQVPKRNSGNVAYLALPDPVL